MGHELPSELVGVITVDEYNRDWDRWNHRRCHLLTRRLQYQLDETEMCELRRLQAFSDFRVDRNCPHPTDLLDRLEQEFGLRK